MLISAITFCGANKVNPLQATVKNISDAKINHPAPELGSDVFVSEAKVLRKKLLHIRQSYIKENPEAFLTLDHIKSNYDNWHTVRSMVEQTENLDAVSKSDFGNLSEILEQIRTPQRMTVYRAMEGNDFNIGRIMPEEFFEKYYEEGKTVTVPIYMHSSLDKNIAYRFAKNNPYRFIIKLDVPENTPAVYMEELAPVDVYDFEDELLVAKNMLVRFGKLTTKINPLNDKPIYVLEGEIVGHKYVKPEPPKLYNFGDDPEYQALVKAMKNKN